MKEYKIITAGCWFTHPETGEKKEAPIGTRVSLTDAKAKALVNKVQLIEEPLFVEDAAPTKAEDVAPTKAEDVTPTKVEDVAPTKVEDVAPPPQTAKKGK